MTDAPSPSFLQRALIYSSQALNAQPPAGGEKAMVLELGFNGLALVALLDRYFDAAEEGQDLPLGPLNEVLTRRRQLRQRLRRAPESGA